MTDDNEHQAPVKVAVAGAVSIVDRQTQDWSVGQIIVPEGRAVQVIGPRTSRVRLLLTAVSGTVYVGKNEQNATVSSGFPVSVGYPIELTTRRDVWAISKPGAPGTLAFLAEHTDG